MSNISSLIGEVLVVPYQNLAPASNGNGFLLDMVTCLNQEVKNILVCCVPLFLFPLCLYKNNFLG